MAEASPARELDQQHLARAAEWFAVLRDTASDEQRHAWQAWRDADPAHAAAWQRVEAINARFLGLAGQVDRGAATLAIDGVRGSRTSRRRGLKLLGALGVSCAVGTLAWRTDAWQDWSSDAHTAFGERRDLRLPDGSTLALNTDTAVRVAYGPDLRRVELLRGEVLVDIAADAALRPWQILTGDGTATSRGGRFSAWKDEAACHIAVFAGDVALRCAGSGLARDLAAGQQARFDRNAIGAPQAAPETLTAWRRGLYVADGLTLEEVSRDLSRHRHGLITCSPEVAALRVVGTFPLDDEPQLWRALARALPIKVSTPLPWWTRIDAA